MKNLKGQKDIPLTYISLFSSAGVGCYGFLKNGFECIATNEIIERRLNIQKYNKKCKYDSGYLCGDITLDETKDLLYKEIDFWKENENITQVDVIIATPPCQGMSVANHKKHDSEIVRNSLVIESIKIIKKIHPKFFVFENVPAFMKTICTDIDGYDKPISDAIFSNLSQEYIYVSKVINFKNYGACSSRTRTIVIGVCKELSQDVSPYDLFPTIEKEKTLRQVIGHLESLKIMGEISTHDIFHFFRPYPSEMRGWICDLKEGESAFDNKDILKRPHQIIDGKVVLNQRKNADKYTRTFWDKVGPCVHTRNDQLASQNTIHPSDDRVFSIRELMLMMTIPTSFKWDEYNLEELNTYTIEQKRKFLRKNEIKIRQSLGEAVPTIIFDKIAKNIKQILKCKTLTDTQILSLLKKIKISTTEEIIKFIRENPNNYSSNVLSKIAEYSNSKRTEEAAYFTSKDLITEMLNKIEVVNTDSVSILEPSCGVGNFVPLILKKFEGKKIEIDLIDIDSDSLEIAKVLLEKYENDNVKFRYILSDFLTYIPDKKYDYIIGNPPFKKMLSTDKKLSIYRNSAINKKTNNICSFFLEKAINISRYVSLVFPKFLLNTPEFEISRNYLSSLCIDTIIDFGEKGFPGVLIETIAINVNLNKQPGITHVYKFQSNIGLEQKQKYIFDKKLPYWVIYRNALFDSVLKKMKFNVFTVFRDRQITNSILKRVGNIKVLKSRNINNLGTEIISIKGYDSFVNENDIKNFSVYNFLDRDDVYLTPNMTYYPRVIRKEKGVLVNGSIAILIPKEKIIITNKQMSYFASDEYRKFYQIARNYQTRSLNIDACSVYFFGLLMDGE